MAKVKEPRPCQACGKIQTDGYKFCRACNLLKEKQDRTKETYKKAHARAARRYQKSHRIKDFAQKVIKYHHNLAHIIYECRCQDGKKQTHHFDYERPLEVMLLCKECHRSEHRRLLGKDFTLEG